MAGGFSLGDLVDHDANVNLAPPSHGMTPLAWAIDFEADSAFQVESVPCMVISKLLFEAGATPTLVDNRGQSAITIANEYVYLEAINCFSNNNS